jgi:hypothetical protein
LADGDFSLCKTVKRSNIFLDDWAVRLSLSRPCSRLYGLGNSPVRVLIFETFIAVGEKEGSEFLFFFVAVV